MVLERDQGFKQRSVAADAAPFVDLRERRKLVVARIQLPALQHSEPVPEGNQIRDADPQWQRIDEHADHRIDVRQLRRSIRDHDSEHDVVVAAIGGENRGPYAQHQRADGDAVPLCRVAKPRRFGRIERGTAHHFGFVSVNPATRPAIHREPRRPAEASEACGPVSSRAGEIAAATSLPSGQSQTSTRSLLRRGRHGDYQALDDLFGRILSRVGRWAHGRLPKAARDLGDTADVVQDAAVGVWKRIDALRLERPGDLDAYIRQAVRNRIHDEARRLMRRAPPVHVDEGIPDLSPSPHRLEVTLCRELLTERRVSLVPLSSEEREILVARFEFGYSYEEIAGLMSKPSAAAARMAVNRILDRLRAELNADGPPRSIKP